MRYKITVKETTSKVVDVDADSIEEAKSKGYDAARDMPEPSYHGPTEIYGYRVGDDPLTRQPRVRS